MIEKQDPLIRRTWANNKVSSTILTSIPIELADKHGIKVGTNLILEDRPDGILFKRLVIK